MTALRVGASVSVHPARASVWTGEVVEVDALGYADHHEMRTGMGVLVLPTMPGRGWSTLPVWLPYERVRAMVEA